MTHKQALIQILRILRDFPADWSDQVWRVVQKLHDPDVEFCLVQVVGFDPLPKSFEDIWNPATYNKEPQP